MKLKASHIFVKTNGKGPVQAQIEKITQNVKIQAGLGFWFLKIVICLTHHLTLNQNEFLYKIWSLINFYKAKAS